MRFIWSTMPCATYFQINELDSNLQTRFIDRFYLAKNSRIRIGVSNKNFLVCCIFNIYYQNNNIIIILSHMIKRFAIHYSLRRMKEFSKLKCFTQLKLCHINLPFSTRIASYKLLYLKFCKTYNS